MKKQVLLLSMLFVFATGFAQITTDAGTFTKPGAGERAFEMNFTPNLDGNNMFSSRIGTLMMRTFKSDAKATRLAATFNISDDGSDGSETQIGINLAYGVENHLAGAERLSTYWGYQGLVGYSDDGTNDAFSIGGGLFLGADYYIMPKVYIGTEFGYGLSIVSGDDTAWGLSGGVTGNLRLGFRL